MTFLNPILAGLGLAAVSIPIIIHLLMRRRRRPVMWAAMRFLLEAYRQHRRRLRLEQFLLLAARCLLIAMVALALGRPLLGAAGLLGRGPVSLYLLVDNGLASSTTAEELRDPRADLGGTGGTALNRHKSAAGSLLSQLDPAAGDRAALLALGGPAQALVLPPSGDTSAVRELVQRLEATDSATDLAGAISLVRDELESAGQRRSGRAVVVVLSDFLAGSADTQRKLAELGKREGITLLASRPAEQGAGNVAITGLEPLRPVVIAPRREQAAAPASVRITLKRSGPGVSDAAVTTVRLALETDGGSRGVVRTPAGQAVARWTPGQTELSASGVMDLSGLPAGANSVVLTGAIDADAIAGDNVYRRPVEIRRALRVGLVAPRSAGSRGGLQQFSAADWFRLALAPAGVGREAEIEPTEIEPANLDATRLAALDAAIVTRPDSLSDASWKRLRAFADGGGLVVITAPAEATVHLWADAMARELGVPWNVAREARTLDSTVALSAAREAGAEADLLGLVAAELDELVKPVSVFRVLPVERAGQARSPAVMKLADGSPLLLAARPGTREAGESEVSDGRGLVVLFTVAANFEWTDLQAKPLMVPLVHEVVRQGVGRARGAWSAVAGTAPEVPARSQELRAISEGPARSIRVAADRAEQPLRNAGLWRALDDRGATRALVAVNADAAAGAGDPQPAATIGAWLGAALPGAEVRWLEPGQSIGGGGQLAAALQRENARTGKLVLPLLLTALLLGVLELAMGRWFSHATIAPAKGGAA